jgi:hypothetical protein
VLLFVCLFLDRVLLYRPGWPQALYLAQHGLEVVKLCFSLQSTEITDMCHHTLLGLFRNGKLVGSRLISQQQLLCLTCLNQFCSIKKIAILEFCVYSLFFILFGATRA